MDPSLFASTLVAMGKISSTINAYVSYAEYLTGHKMTSSFGIIEESLKEFYSRIFLGDFKRIYGLVVSSGQNAK